MRAVIDRIEGEIAVVLLGDEETQVALPHRYLPARAQEGSILRVTFEADEAATKTALESAAARIERLKSLSRRQ